MDLIDEENGPFSVHSQTVFRGLYCLLHVLFAGGRGIELDELRARGIGDHPRQGCLARPGGTVKNQRPQLVRLDGPSEKTPPSDNMLLPYHFVQRGGPDPGSQRRFRLLLFLPHVIK